MAFPRNTQKDTSTRQVTLEVSCACAAPGAGVQPYPALGCANPSGGGMSGLRSGWGRVPSEWPGGSHPPPPQDGQALFVPPVEPPRPCRPSGHLTLRREKPAKQRTSETEGEA